MANLQRRAVRLPGIVALYDWAAPTVECKQNDDEVAQQKNTKTAHNNQSSVTCSLKCGWWGYDWPQTSHGKGLLSKNSIFTGTKKERFDVCICLTVTLIILVTQKTKGDWWKDLSMSLETIQMFVYFMSWSLLQSSMLITDFSCRIFRCLPGNRQL